jgi:hypothetical protein
MLHGATPLQKMPLNDMGGVFCVLPSLSTKQTPRVHVFRETDFDKELKRARKSLKWLPCFL